MTVRIGITSAIMQRVATKLNSFRLLLNPQALSSLLGRDSMYPVGHKRLPSAVQCLQSTVEWKISKAHECENRNHIRHHAEGSNKIELLQALIEYTGFIITIGSGFHVGHKRLPSAVQCLQSTVECSNNLTSNTSLSCSSGCSKIF